MAMRRPPWLSFLLLAAAVHSTCAQQWVAPYFEAPIPGPGSVVFPNHDGSSTLVGVKMDENVPSETKVHLTTITYSGPNKPTFGSISGSDTTIMDADQVDVAPQWRILVIKSQDAETTSTAINMRIDIPNDPTVGYIIFNINNLNDEPPSIIAPNSCTIKETHALDNNIPGCEIKIKDRDGVEFGGSSMLLSATSATATFDLVKISNTLYELNAALRIKNNMLDYETLNLHTLTLTATNEDNVTLTNSVDMLLKVEDEPDQLPIWTKQPLSTYQIEEESTGGFVFSARDGDTGINAEITYRMTNPNPSEGTFELVSADPDPGMKLQVTPGDRDTNPTLVPTVTVCAYEVVDQTSEICENVAVIITDKNDNSPEINPNILEDTIDEGAAVALIFGSLVTITDLDLGLNGQFNITLDSANSEWNNVFMVVPTSGYQSQVVTISVVDPTKIDYEDINSREIILTLKATEIADPTRTGTATITVTVTDVNDELPEFDQTSYNASMREDAVKDDIVITVTATDKDASDVITYSLLPVNAPVTIDSSTGVVTVKKDNAFNYEIETNVQVQVKATDKASHSTYADLFIEIEDVNDTPPVLTLSATDDLTIDENSITGTLVTNSDTSISASDVDTTADLVFTIDWTRSYATRKGIRVTDVSVYQECLIIEPIPEMTKMEASALLKASDKNLLNYEKFDALNLMIGVEDINQETGVGKRSGALIVLLNNLDDNPPLFDQDLLDTEKHVLEGTADNTLIGYVLATDPDELSVITYTMVETGSTPVGWLKIGLNNGELRTTNVSINAEDERLTAGLTLTYNVTASDSTQSSTAGITIIVDDVNDEYPTFVYPTLDQEVSAIENAENDTEILASMDATDNDVSKDDYGGNFRYSLNPDYADYGALDRMLVVDATTGRVTAKGGNDPLDIEKYPDGLRVAIRVTDNGDRPPGKPVQLYGNSYFKIMLIDENDKTPEFTTNEVLPSVLETLPATSLVYQGITATDADITSPFNDITYEITAIVGENTLDPGLNFFYLIQPGQDGRNTADLYTTNALAGKFDRYTISIQAMDNNGMNPFNDVTKVFKLEVVDVNDHSPVFVYPNDDNIQVAREQGAIGDPLQLFSGGPVPNIVATDEDDAKNAEVGFTIIGDGDAMRYITIRDNEDNTATLLVKELFAEAPAQFDLIISAADKGEEPKIINSTTRIYVKTGIPYEPYFPVPNDTQTIRLTEELSSYAEYPLNSADDANNLETPPEDWEPIYYYIHNAIEGNKDLFSIEPSNINKLQVIGRIDHEEFTRHILEIVASNSPTPPVTPIPEQILTLTINVDDIIDFPPYFEFELYVGGIAPSDTEGYEVMRISASDKDDPALDTLNYIIVEGSMNASEPDLQAVMDTAFRIETTNFGNPTENYEVGVIKTYFTPNAKQFGYFRFQVEVHDSQIPSAGKATTWAQVYIISESNRVYFLFLNDINEVNSNRENIIAVFNYHLGYYCAIDEVKSVDDTQNRAAISNRTSVRTHFIDNTTNTPVEGYIIERKASDLDTLLAMQQDLSEYGLNLIDVLTSSQDAGSNLTTILTIVLIVVTVVLGSLVIVLFVAFILKTRSLNRRLKALSTTQFGSQESGLNRLGMHVPNTNKHAVEGSNPVWNEDVPPSYDNISEGSGDSDLIGVEDRPEFGYGKSDTRLSSGPGGSQEGGYYSGSDLAAAVANSANDPYEHVSTEL